MGAPTLDYSVATALMSAGVVAMFVAPAAWIGALSKMTMGKRSA